MYIGGEEIMAHEKISDCTVSSSLSTISGGKRFELITS